MTHCAGGGPLAGIRVLELTQVMAGPFSGLLLADLGADVIKVESPAGDSSRRGFGIGMRGEDSAAFLAVNRNKRSVQLDLKDSADRESFVALARTADVVIENFRPGVVTRLGIDYAALSVDHPELIYASISGFGQVGPKARLPGYDLLAQAASGLMSVTGNPDGPPVKCGVPVSDLSAGLLCAVGVLAALHERARTGRGQQVSTSLFEAALSLSLWETAELWATQSVPQPLGSAHRFLAPYQAFKARDGYLVVAANTDPMWRRFCTVIDRPQLIDDPMFATVGGRLATRSELTKDRRGARRP